MPNVLPHALLPICFPEETWTARPRAADLGVQAGTTPGPCSGGSRHSERLELVFHLEHQRRRCSLPTGRAVTAMRHGRFRHVADRGLTVLELLVALAAIGVLLALGMARVVPASSEVAAGSVQSSIQRARFQALKLNRPVVVDVDAENGVVTVHAGTMAGSIDCGFAQTTPITRLDLSTYPHVRLNARLQRFVWLPNGQARGCSGEWIGDEAIAELSDGRRAYEVVLAAGGAVSLR